MTSNHTDLLVLGGGTMGTAAGWAASRRGHSVRVLEQFSHVHTQGSHSGITRIFRHAYAEGADYVPWALEADDAWHALQERTGESFMHRVGCLDMSSPGAHHAASARRSAEVFDLDFEWLTGADVRERFPVWNLPDEWEACYTTQSGYIEVEPALKSMAREIEQAGGVIETDCRVTSWTNDGDGVLVESTQGAFTADALVITAGAWNIHMLKQLRLPLEVRRKPVLWFNSSQPETITPDVFPCWIAETAHGEFYGLPQVDVPGMKAGVHSGGIPSDPETLDREVHSSDVDEQIGPFIRDHMNGFTGELEQTSICMYTMTQDENFLIDRHPEHGNIAFGAGFSGHGFKFAPVIGEHLVDLALDATAQPRESFALYRFATLTNQT